LESTDSEGKGTRQAILNLRRDYMRQQYPKLADADIEYRAEHEPLRFFPDENEGNFKEKFSDQDEEEEDSSKQGVPAPVVSAPEKDYDKGYSLQPHLLPKDLPPSRPPVPVKKERKTEPISAIAVSQQKQEATQSKLNFRQKFAQRNIRQLSFALPSGEEVCPVVPMAAFGPLQSPVVADFPGAEEDDLRVAFASPRSQRSLTASKPSSTSSDGTSSFSSNLEDGFPPQEVIQGQTYFPLPSPMYPLPSPGLFHVRTPREDGVAHHEHHDLLWH